MPKFHYAKHGESWGVASVVDDATYETARDLFAESLGIPASSLEYLVQYGVNQTTQDSMAQPVAKAKEEGGDAVSAAIAAANKRWDTIADGTAGVRGGGFRVTDPFEKAVREIVDEAIKKAAKAKGKKLPKGEAYQKLRDATYNANKTVIDAEATKRVEVASAMDIAVKL